MVEGRFKTPLLRGPLSLNIDRHSKIERQIAKDLQNWMCNMYFRIIKLPRYTAGQREFEVELQFTSGILGYPEREMDADEEETQLGDVESRGSAGSGAALVGSTSNSNSNSNSSDAAARRRSMRPLTGINSRVRRRLQTRQSTRAGTAAGRSDGFGDDDSDIGDETNPAETEPASGDLGDGLSYTIRPDPSDKYFQKVFIMQPKERSMRRQRAILNREERLQQHTFSVQDVFFVEERRPAREKLAYVGRQLMSELGLSQARSKEFWGFWFFMIVVFWLRIWTHYLFQWIFLWATDIPVSKFDFEVFSVELLYLVSRQLAGWEGRVRVWG